MSRRNHRDSVEDHLRSEGFYLAEKAERERAINRHKPRTVRYDRRMRNRRMAYMDLVVLLIMLGVLIPFANQRFGQSDTLYGFATDWDYSFGTDRVYHSLTVSAPEALSAALPDGLLIEATFTATGGESVTVTDLAPDAGEERLLTASIPLEELPDYVGCTVVMGEKEKSYKTFTGKVRAIPLFKRPGK